MKADLFVIMYLVCADAHNMTFISAFLIYYLLLTTNLLV